MGGHGGHGGLNILFHKRWNVYGFDNREKILQDEEAAAKEEQLKREQSRKRDAKFRLEKLRQARGIAPSAHATTSSVELELKSESKSDSNHINLFEGIKIFDPVRGGIEGEVEKKDGNKKVKLMKKEKEPKVVMPEDEKYRLGYGVAGKGVKLPWYLVKPSDNEDGKSSGNHSDDDGKFRVGKEGVKSSGKKTLQELREERLKRERREKERERALILEKSQKDGGFSSRRR